MGMVTMTGDSRFSLSSDRMGSNTSNPLPMESSATICEHFQLFKAAGGFASNCLRRSRKRCAVGTFGVMLVYVEASLRSVAGLDLGLRVDLAWRFKLT